MKGTCRMSKMCEYLQRSHLMVIGGTFMSSIVIVFYFSKRQKADFYTHYLLLFCLVLVEVQTTWAIVT